MLTCIGNPENSNTGFSQPAIITEEIINDLGFRSSVKRSETVIQHHNVFTRIQQARNCLSESVECFCFVLRKLKTYQSLLLTTRQIHAATTNLSFVSIGEVTNVLVQTTSFNYSSVTLFVNCQTITSNDVSDRPIRYPCTLMAESNLTRRDTNCTGRRRYFSKNNAAEHGFPAADRSTANCDSFGFEF